MKSKRIPRLRLCLWACKTRTWCQFMPGCLIWGIFHSVYGLSLLLLKFYIFQCLSYCQTVFLRNIGRNGCRDHEGYWTFAWHRCGPVCHVSWFFWFCADWPCSAVFLFELWFLRDRGFLLILHVLPLMRLLKRGAAWSWRTLRLLLSVWWQVLSPNAVSFLRGCQDPRTPPSPCIRFAWRPSARTFDVTRLSGGGFWASILFLALCLTKALHSPRDQNPHFLPQVSSFTLFLFPV